MGRFEDSGGSFPSEMWNDIFTPRSEKNAQARGVNTMKIAD